MYKIAPLFLLLTACATNPKIVYVPVGKPCVMPELPPEPTYPITKLTKQSKPSDFVKACIATIGMQQDRIKMCEKGRKANE